MVWGYKGLSRETFPWLLGRAGLVAALTLSADRGACDEFYYVDRNGKSHRVSPNSVARGASDAARSSSTSRSAFPVAQFSGSTDAPFLVPVASQRGPDSVCSAAVQEASAMYQLPEELLLAVIEVESNFRATAISASGACGLMQLLPSTAADMGVTDVFDSRQNILGGARYLRWLTDRFGSNLNKVLAAYNAGPGTVERAGGIPADEGVQRYIYKVNEAYRRWVRVSASKAVSTPSAHEHHVPR